MQEGNKSKTSSGENEVDLGVFFSLLSRLARKIAGVINSFFLTIYQLIIFILLFIKRRVIWLALGGLIGLAFGIQQYLSNGPSYYSDMIVRSNFESTPLLYNKIDYFNSLIKQQRFKELAAIFNISEAEASRLINFGVTPISNDVEAAKLYRKAFFENSKRSLAHGIDTLWTKAIKFADFKKELKPQDFPLQQIRLYSSNPNLYANVESGIVLSINNNKALQALRVSTTSVFQEEENILKRSLNGLDSLRQAYYKRIAGRTADAETNNVIVTDKELRNPEVELFEKELLVKDELIYVQRRTIDQQELLQVTAGFNPTGTKVSGLQQDFSVYAWWGILVVFSILLLIELYRYLDRYEKSITTPPHFNH